MYNKENILRSHEHIFNAKNILYIYIYIYSDTFLDHTYNDRAIKEFDF